jgi:aminopeptidase N
MDGPVSESLVVHEIGHIYFYGIFGNNERAEAWLDEGFTTFQTNWYMMTRYGPYGDRSKWPPYKRLTPQYTLQEELRRRVFELHRDGYAERVATRAEDFKNDYYSMVYRKAATMFFALKYMVGDEKFEEILHEYFRRYKFKHVNEDRFREVAEDVSGTELDWFFSEWLHTNKTCDYRLDHIGTSPSPRGDGYVSQIRIDRLGEMRMPLKLVITFEDGTTKTISIDGQLRSIERTLEFPVKPKSAALNPDNEIFDINMQNNHLPRRRSYQFDWPNNHYYPENAYQLRYYPMAWYNDVDQARLWFRVHGNRSSWNRLVSMAVYYGTNSHRLDFSASWKEPVTILRRRAKYEISGYKVEGRQDFTAELAYQSRKELIRPPTQQAKIGINYHRLTDARYINPEQWQFGSDVAPYFTYSIDPQFDVVGTNLDAKLRLGRQWFGGDFKYTTFALNGWFKSRRGLVPIDTDFRLFFGAGEGDIPRQNRFYLGGGGPLAEEKRFWLRSRGAIPKDFNYQEPGMGNLRGYFQGSFGVRGLFAMNLQMGTSVPFLSRSPSAGLGEFKWYVFGDAGWILDSENPDRENQRIEDLVQLGVLGWTLADAGVGITWRKNLPFWNMLWRFDVPLYVNHPEINGETEKTKYRWVFSFLTTF